MNDTIAAISTAPGVGGISIIRVSGEDAISIVNKIFKGKDLRKVDSHTIHYGHIYEKDKLVDEVLVSVMKKPKTFTQEDTVEINCHGGILVTKKVLELVLEQGARLADPGEFTKRAFLNGRIDLTQAEGIMDLISSKSSDAMTLALNQLTGSVKEKIQNIREEAITLITKIEVNIDYPEYEENVEVTLEELKKEFNKIKEDIKDLLKHSEDGKVINAGFKTAIIGKPNVGKSSLLNLLLEEEKAIVTEIEGTTRDTVEGSIIIDGFILNLIDTAGIRKTTDKVEEIGVKKSLELIKKADLILFMLDNSMNLTKEEEELMEKIKEKKHIIIVNKTDLDSKLKLEDENIVKISAKEKKGIDTLKAKIKDILNITELKGDLTYLTNARSIALLKQCYKKCEEVEKSIKNKMPVDFIEIDIKSIWESLGKIIGETYEEEMLDELFKRFCLGK